MMRNKRMLVLMARVKGKDLPIAIYPDGTPNGLVNAHLDQARATGLDLEGYRLLALPLLLVDDILYVPPGTRYPSSARVQEVHAPIFLL